ncbi:MAG: cysteine synthase [bacterium]
MQNIHNNILSLIGNTPLVKINKLNPNKQVEIFAKLESFNPGGSIKDRIALSMIETAEQKRELTKDKTIIEATSGNTGIGLALVASVKGYKLKIAMSESASLERIKILKAFGAEIILTSAHLGTDGAIEEVYKLAREYPDKYYLTDQYNNKANPLAHYKGTAEEIWTQTQGRVTHIIVALGTTGTAMGISRRLKEYNPNIKIIAIEPYLGHSIQGLKNMKESYRPGIFKKDAVDEIVNVEDEDAFEMSRKLAKEKGLFVGMSSGAAMVAALKKAVSLDSGLMVVIFPDGGDRYLSTSLFNEKEEPSLKMYNTLTRKKENFTPLKAGQVSMYTCGPTVDGLLSLRYWRRFVVADMVKRYLEFKGFQVKHIVNITDIDDRTISASEKAGLSLKEFTENYTNEFFKEIDILRIKRANVYPRASEHIQEMIELAQKLQKKGYAYEKLRSVYFDISRFKDYGCLSHIDLNKIKIGSSVDLDNYAKDNPRDFTLFKRATLSELKRGIFYKTEWGNVRPGWHIECPAMAMKYLGETLDIHTSDINLLFPHHENEIAISEAATNKRFVKYWIHNEQVVTNTNKPYIAERGIKENEETGGQEDKKTGRQEDRKTGGQEPGTKNEERTLMDLLDKGYTGREIRYWLLSAYYRKQVDFSYERLEKTRQGLARIDNFISRLMTVTTTSHDNESTSEVKQYLYDLMQKFISAMDDDFNISEALASIFEFISKMNLMIDQYRLTFSQIEGIVKGLKKINEVLDVFELTYEEGNEDVLRLVNDRDKARAESDWEKADRIREQLIERGYVVHDTKTGTKTFRKSKEGI